MARIIPEQFQHKFAEIEKHLDPNGPYKNMDETSRLKCAVVDLVGMVKDLVSYEDSPARADDNGFVGVDLSHDENFEPFFLPEELMIPEGLVDIDSVDDESEDEQIIDAVLSDDDPAAELLKLQPSANEQPTKDEIPPAIVEASITEVSASAPESTDQSATAASE